MDEKLVEQDKITREEVLVSKHFNRSKKRGIGDQESLASNVIATEDWTNKVKLLATRKLKVSCTNDTIILLIQLMRRDDYEREFTSKRKDKVLARCQR